MARVLFVGDDAGTAQIFSGILELAGFDFVAAATGRDALRLAKQASPDVALIDCPLPDITGLDVLRKVRATTPEMSCVLISGVRDYSVEFEAIALGARACISKPIVDDELTSIVQLALDTRDYMPHDGFDDIHIPLAPATAHALRRLTESVITLIKSPDDKCTLRDFGRAVGISSGGFRSWCHTADLHARQVLLFARGLRATIRQGDSSLGANNLLDICDSRTLRKFVAKCGGTGDRLPPGQKEFIDGQQFIDQPEFLKVVRAALESAHLPAGRRA